MSLLLEKLITAVSAIPGATAAELEDLSAAFVIAARHHVGEWRKSGDPYITHPVAVAKIVAAWGQPILSVQAAVLHDVPSEHLAGEIRADLLALVRLTQDLDHVPSNTDAPRVLAGFPDRALILKLADRFHNAQTWHAVEPSRAALKARETLSIYVPVARRLSIPSTVASDLTTLSTRTLQPSPVMHRAAVSIVPADLRSRYRGEWLAELDHLHGSARWRFSAGLIYSAIVLRAQRAV